MKMPRLLSTFGNLLTRSSQRERMGIARWESEGGALAGDDAGRVPAHGILLRDRRWKRPYAR